MKKIASILLCFSFLFLLAADLSAGDRSRDTSVIKTRYFDIIYREPSAETAALLAEYADGFADEICALLATSMKGRIPVYLDPDVDILNASFTTYPYNRICLYDTVPSDGSLGVFRNTILKVFYHELTHAVSINDRSPFWQFMSGIFGDSLSVNMLVTMPLSFIEGITVSFESRDGEGRLNDPLIREYLVQDKIEGKFLDWKQAAGALDLYPASESSYLYGGAFSAWLQKVYGMEKYAELWKRGGSLSLFRSGIEGRFSQVYGLSLDTAWSQFRDALTVPESIGKNDRRLGGTGDGIYSCLASGPDGLAWYDGNAGCVLFRDNGGKVHKLFDSDGTLNRLSFSPDGRLLLVSDASVSEKVIKSRARIFDMARGKYLGELYPGLRDASFAGSSAVVCGIETRAQRSFLVLHTRAENPQKRILLEAGPGRPFYLLFNPVYAGAGTLACIGANGSERQLLVFNIDTGKASAATLPENVGCLRYLQSSEVAGHTVLTFSWAGKDTLYRYGIYRPADGSLSLQDQDYSGGVFCPVYDQFSASICYVASFSGHDALMTLPETSPSVSKIDRSTDKPLPSPVSFPFPAAGLPGSAGSVPFNPLPWFAKGTFIPWISELPIDTGWDKHAPGFFYVTSDPSGSLALTASPFFSIDPFYADWSLDLLASFRSYSVLVQSQDHLKSGLGSSPPYRDTSMALSLSRTCTPEVSWKTLLCSLTGTAHWYAPDADRHHRPYETPYTALSVAGDTGLVYSAIRKNRLAGFPLFRVAQTGLSAGVYGYYGMLYPDKAATPILQTEVSSFFPHIPLSVALSSAWSDGLLFSPVAVYAEAKCVRDFTSGVVRYVPSFPEYANTKYELVASSRVFGVVAEFTPLTLEIQKGIPFLPAYSNRFIVSTGYRGALFDTGDESRFYVDSVYARASMQGALVTGILYSVLLTGAAEYALPLRAGTGRMSFSLGTNIEL